MGRWGTSVFLRKAFQVLITLNNRKNYYSTFYRGNDLSRFDCLIMPPPPPKGEGGHISFSADPGRLRRRDSFVSIISLESMGGI